ncbi:PAS domain-containing sensor histidine kinase [Burkholderia anthina]|uniref:PAS domain-containing sensor histidine kinase n=1 Tax=Burkholderia anthina TaxID=179879 RepID=UPI001AA06609|nr:PAS domain S-box protein [Burkholderia anthina]QTD94702.1 PAS domain S-box protein [Burkholderia anthina]
MMHDNSTDVLAVAGLVLILGIWAWVFRRLCRAAASDDQTNAMPESAANTVRAAGNRDQVVLHNPAAERMVGRGTPYVAGTAIAARMPEGRPAALPPHRTAAESGERSEPAGDVTRCGCDVSAGNPARYRALVELNPVATWLMHHGVIVCVNDACLALLGAAGPPDVVGTSSSDWLDPEGLKGVRQQLAGLPGARPARPEPTAGRVSRRNGLTRDVDVMAIAPDHACRAWVLLTFQDVTRRNATERELRESRDALRELARALQRAREAERISLAFQLHEELAQQINVVKMEIDALNACYPALTNRNGFVHAANRKIGAHLDNLVARVRQLTADLRPPMLDDLGLAATLEWLAQDLFSRYGLKIDTNLAEPDVDTAAAAILYRIAREALEYAKLREPASHVSMHLQKLGGFVTLTVREDGRIDDAFVSGVRPSALFSIREQVATIGGDADWKTLRTGGQELVIHLPARARR